MDGVVDGGGVVGVEGSAGASLHQRRREVRERKKILGGGVVPVGFLFPPFRFLAGGSAAKSGTVPSVA